MEEQRDHLFISYAWEDAAFAEWLALKLTAEGYRVWCDRFKLLGGESYPRDIDRAIREQTFRVLALLSHASINKPNPLKERTLALNLARQRNEDFLIPLNVDGLLPTELGWMLSDLTYVPFHHSWAEGLRQLLGKLTSLNAPRSRADGKQAVSSWFAERDAVAEIPERIWTNLLAVHEIPQDLLRITLASRPPASVLAGWPYQLDREGAYWAFEAPEQSNALDVVDVEAVPWDASYVGRDPRLGDVVTHLIKAHLLAHCERKGMSRTPDGRHMYFPAGLLSGEWISYVGYNGRRTRVRAVGERTFRGSTDQRERSRYHLSPDFRPALWKYDRPVVQAQIRVYLTDLAGRLLESDKAARRRKAIGKHWWNHEWLSRLLAVSGWIADDADYVNLARSPGCRLILAGAPLSAIAPVGINESALGALMLDDEVELTEDDAPDDYSQINPTADD